MTVNKLWARYRQKRTDERRNDLVTHYLPLAHIHAGKVRRTVAQYLSIDEILGAASLGLIQAVEGFDSSRKLKFETFSGHRIRGAILDWLRDLDTQSRTVRIFEKKKLEAEELLGHNDVYGDSQVATEMGISYQRYTLLNKLVSHGKQTYLSILTGSDYPHWDVEDKNSPDPTCTINRSFLQEFICIGLRRQHRQIIILHYFEGLTLREIADMVNLSESRIGQIRMQALDQIRRNLEGTIYEREKLLLA